MKCYIQGFQTSVAIFEFACEYITIMPIAFIYSPSSGGVNVCLTLKRLVKKTYTNCKTVKGVRTSRPIDSIQPVLGSPI